MKSLLYALAISLSVTVATAQSEYNYSADIANIVNDEVSVTLLVPEMAGNEATFSFPKAIPGSYANKDFGRFIKNFKAFDKNGKSLPVKRINVNQFTIKKAKNLYKLQYQVNDTWDYNYSNFVFQPGGSNIDAGKNVVMNNHAFFGYFEGYQNIPFRVSVTRPQNFYASTHLDVEHPSATNDVLIAKNYSYLADNPVLYDVPDTTSFAVGNSTINVSVYSVSGKVKSKQVAEYLKPLSIALSKFFNGLPVKSYQFLFYFEDASKALTGNGEGGYGALEHNYSSLYFLPEIALESRLHSLVNEVSGHEFLHIQTPLNLHSEEIENFDFINPKMSQHLWLYEGVTEYFANLVQVQNGLLTKEEFFKNMRDKLNEAEEFGQFSMTEMSKNVLTEQYKSKYNSVYNKGALLGFMLDLFIRQKTNNAKDLKSVVQTLSAKYGPNRPFKDDELFDEFIKASHPDVAGFIDDYIKGSKPLPLQQMLQTIGYTYKGTASRSTYNVGQKLGLAYDDVAKKFVFRNVGANVIDLKSGDMLVAVDGIPVSGENINDVWDEYFQYNTKHPEFVLTVDRDGQTLKLSGKLVTATAQIKNYLGPVDDPSEEQVNNLRLLLNGK